MRTKLLRPALAFDRNKALTEYLTASLSSARSNKQHQSQCGKCHVQPRFRWEKHIVREWLLQYSCSTLILHLTSAFTQTIANMVTKPSSSWGEHYIFREVYLFFQNTGAAYISLPTYVDVRQCIGTFQAYGLPILYPSRNDTVPEEQNPT